MTTLIGVCTTRAGQTSTFLAISLAWAIAEAREVVLVDCDMEGGTVADLLFLDLDGQTIANCFGDRPADASEVSSQAVSVPARPHLRVVPGLRSTFGFEISECLAHLERALPALDCEVVVVDLGHPFSHPGLRSSRAAGQAVCGLLHRLFIVIRDEPALLLRTIEVLQAARLPYGELVLCGQRSDAHRRAVIATLERELPDLPIRSGWSWDERKAARAALSGSPIAVEGLLNVWNL